MSSGILDGLPVATDTKVYTDHPSAATLLVSTFIIQKFTFTCAPSKEFTCVRTTILSPNYISRLKSICVVEATQEYPRSTKTSIGTL